MTSSPTRKFFLVKVKYMYIYIFYLPVKVLCISTLFRKKMGKGFLHVDENSSFSLLA